MPYLSDHEIRTVVARFSDDEREAIAAHFFRGFPDVGRKLHWCDMRPDEHISASRAYLDMRAQEHAEATRQQEQAAIAKSAPAQSSDRQGTRDIESGAGVFGTDISRTTDGEGMTLNERLAEELFDAVNDYLRRAWKAQKERIDGEAAALRQEIETLKRKDETRDREIAELTHRANRQSEHLARMETKTQKLAAAVAIYDADEALRGAKNVRRLEGR